MDGYVSWILVLVFVKVDQGWVCVCVSVCVCVCVLGFSSSVYQSGSGLCMCVYVCARVCVYVSYILDTSGWVSGCVPPRGWCQS